MLDFELAELYGVPTKALNQAVRRNIGRFPKDFAYQLTDQEVTNLRSQFVTANSTLSKRRFRPWVFTEHGVAMLSSVLNSPKAIKLNIEIMRAFVRLRRLLATPGDLITHLQHLTEMVHDHDGKIKVITDVIAKMLKPPPEPKGRFGFHPPAKTTEPTKEKSK